MAKILIDMTNRNKRHISGVGLCKYCRKDIMPHGKIINLDTDKEAIRMNDGSWKCGVCVREDFEKTTKLMNRHKEYD